MKRILFILIGGVITSYSSAQSLDPQVISTAGTSFVSGGNVLDWTLGEPATFTLNNGNLLTQGFHQPELTAVAIGNIYDNDGITVFPNPTADFIQVKFEKGNENNTLELFSVEGKLILSQQTNSNTTSQIDMSPYSNGTYMLRIKNKSSKDKSYQIVKLK